MERIKAFFAGIDYPALFTHRVSGQGPQVRNWLTERLGGPEDRRSEFLKNFGSEASDMVKVAGLAVAAFVVVGMLALGWWIPLMIVVLAVPILLGLYAVAGVPVLLLGGVAVFGYLSQVAFGGFGSDYDAGWTVGGLSLVTVAAVAAFLLRQDWKTLLLTAGTIAIGAFALSVFGIDEEGWFSQAVGLVGALVVTFLIVLIYQAAWFNAVAAMIGASAVITPRLLFSAETGENVETLTDALVEQAFLGGGLLLFAALLFAVAWWDRTKPESPTEEAGEPETEYQPESAEEREFISNLKGHAEEWGKLSREQRELIVILWPFQREHRLLQLKRNAFVKRALAKADVEDAEIKDAGLEPSVVRYWLAEKFVADVVDEGIVRENGRLLKSKLKDIGITNKKIEDESVVSKADYRAALAARRES